MNNDDVDSWLLELYPTAKTVPQTESYVSLRRELVQLRSEYVKIAKPDVARVRTYLLGWDCTTVDDAFNEILSLVHSLRGTAASYGFAELGTVAGEVEELLRFFCEHHVVPPDCGLYTVVKRWDAAATYNGLD